MYPLPAGPAHMQYIATVGFCNQFTLRRPTAYINSGLSSLDALVGIQAAQVPTATDTQIAIYDAPDGLIRSKHFVNLGASAVTPHIQTFKKMDSVEIGLDNTAAHTIRGAVSHSSPSGVNAFTTTNGLTGQTVAVANWKLLSNGSYDCTSGNQFPIGLQIQHFATRSAGANSLAGTALSVDCQSGQTNVAISTVRGDNRFNTTSGTNPSTSPPSVTTSFTSRELV